MAELKVNKASQISSLEHAKAEYLAKVLEQIKVAKKEVNALTKTLDKHRLMQQAQTLRAPV